MGNSPQNSYVLPLRETDLYVINLNESRERWTQCFRKLSGIFHRNRIHRVTAIDGRTFAAPGDNAEWQPSQLLKLQREGLVGDTLRPDPVRTALCLSHQRALRQFLNQLPSGTDSSHSQWALILEDDAIPAGLLLNTDTEHLSLHLPGDAEVLFLHDRVLTCTAPSSSATAHPANGCTPVWRPVVGGIGLEAYLVNPIGARKILAAWKPLHFECDLQLMPFAKDFSNSAARATLFKALQPSDASRPNIGADDLITCYAPHRPLFQIDQSLPSVKFQFLGEASPSSTPPPSASKLPNDPITNLDLKSPIAFATSFFNPCHFRSRLENFLRFHDGMQHTNLAVIELAFEDDEWQLPDDLPNLIRLRSNTICWQKEALLNHGLHLLAAHPFSYLGWLDADILFENCDWQQRLLESLQSKRLCQVFESVTTSFPDRGAEHSFCAAAAWTRYGRSPLHCGVTGFGWAMHRDVWEKSRLFDLNIIGGGDHVMWRSAFYDVLDADILFADRSYPKSLTSPRNTWASSWSSSIAQKIGFARSTRIKSLPHGHASNRRYLERGKILHHHQFDYARHLYRDAHQLHQWSSHAPQSLKTGIHDYFLNRAE